MALSEILGCELGHAGGCVIPSENISKQWKIRNIWKWDHEEWELYSRLAIDFFFFLMEDLLTFERWRPVPWRVIGIWAVHGVICPPPLPSPHIQTLTHPPSGLNWISYKTF